MAPASDVQELVVGHGVGGAAPLLGLLPLPLLAVLVPPVVRGQLVPAATQGVGEGAGGEVCGGRAHEQSRA